MDDDLVLNLVLDEGKFVVKSGGKKGGRWTDRLKAKRVTKRKVKTEEPQHNIISNDSAQSQETGQPPAKRARKEIDSNYVQPSHLSRPTQVISSLFSFNPKIEPPKPATHGLSVKPSNAPLDFSTFQGLGLDPLLVSHLASKSNIKKPTSIQQAALPVLLTPVTDECTARDVFIQSQTGSGKTLSFLLPIIQDLLPLSSLSYIDRSIGTLAIIIVPTRELAKQISNVLEMLLQLRLRPEDSSKDEIDTSTRLTRWLVSGLLIGGATRTHEKARLRKGVPILVSTPGRLLDHLQNTSSFNVGKCRWLVLDEADSLMELGFEETIKGIISGLDGRRRLSKQAAEVGKSTEVGGWDWERRRRTILCSATLKEDVQRLSGTALVDPLMIKPVLGDATTITSPSGVLDVTKNSAITSEKFTPPSQLSQKYIIAPLKLRLVALIALLRSIVAQSNIRQNVKIMVFLSCTDSVDFHWSLLGSSAMSNEEMKEKDSDGDDDENNGDERSDLRKGIEARCTFLPNTSLFRLHGSLSTATRLAVIKRFSAASSLQKAKRPDLPPSASILLCTSVASRGLDLPLIRAVVQYDLPTEGGATEYLHRVGRTARAGKGGEAWSIVAPSEAEWTKLVETEMQNGDVDRSSIALNGVSVENVLRSGFGGKGNEYEARATEVQLAFERWVLNNKYHTTLARQAFLSHIRAYATHPSEEKHIFHVRHLHLGHLAKAFALREAPKFVTNTTSRTIQPTRTPKDRKLHTTSHPETTEWTRDRSGEAEKRMQAIVRAQGRLTKKGGVMVSSGASEFQIAGGSVLEKLVQGV